MTTPHLRTARLDLAPLAVGDAAEMAVVLADPALYAFTGGEPPDPETLARRYGRLVAGPAEIFDPRNPAAGWSQTVPTAHPRGYHSSAILLTDGSVLNDQPRARCASDAPTNSLE